MDNVLYNNVYDYLTEFSSSSQGEYEYINYMNYLSGMICQTVNSTIMEQRQISEVAKYFWKIAEEANKPLKILIAGEFKTGKSTFINTLLGRVILKSDIMPATAVVTHICYGEEESLVVEMKDGTKWTYPLSVLSDLTSEGNTHYDNLRRKIKIVYVQLPLAFLRYVTLIDSPGLNVRLDYHIKATEDALQDADFVIWIMNMSQAAKKGELSEIRKLPSYLKPLVVFNGIDLIDPEEENVNEAIGQAMKRVEKVSLCSFGTSAYQTWRAIQENDNLLYKEYGWESFLNYFKQNICWKWFVWKAKAMVGKLKKYEDNDLKNNLKDYLEKKKKYTQIIRESKYHNWLRLEEFIQKRKALEILISDSNKELKALFSKKTNTVNNEEVERITSVMQGINYVLQEMQIINPFSREQYMQLQNMYQYYSQAWSCLQYYMNNISGGSYDVQVIQQMEVIAQNFVGYNNLWLETYYRLTKLQDEEEERNFELQKEPIYQLKNAIRESEILDTKINGFELFVKIQARVNLDI